MSNLEGKRILVTGGTGSLGNALVRRLLAGEMGLPAKITVFSRDEAKQHYMRLDYMHKKAATDDVIYENSKNLLSFRIGDVRDYSSLLSAMRDADRQSSDQNIAGHIPPYQAGRRSSKRFRWATPLLRACPSVRVRRLPQTTSVDSRRS